MTSGPTTHASGEALTIQKVTPRDPGRMELASPAFSAGEPIPDRFTAYFDNISPPLSWTMLPEAEAFALIVEDPDAPTDKPVVHWMVWNIPGTADGLPQDAGRDGVAGAVQGMNAHGEHGYLGPKPPAGHGPHRYHFQLFALDKRLDMPPSTPLAELLNALKGNTIAQAELIGIYEAPTSQ
jgi:Raf kinase inhibitor-like YbhB/YbcL family protein